MIHWLTYFTWLTNWCCWIVLFPLNSSDSMWISYMAPQPPERSTGPFKQRHDIFPRVFFPHSPTTQSLFKYLNFKYTGHLELEFIRLMTLENQLGFKIFHSVVTFSERKWNKEALGLLRKLVIIKYTLNSKNWLFTGYNGIVHSICEQTMLV